MTDKEAVALAIKEFKNRYAEEDSNKKWLKETIHGLKLAYRKLNILDELENPLSEEEIENYLITREAYRDEYDNELKYGYTIYEWRGEYCEKPLSPVSEKTFKFKKWEKIFHTTSTKKYKEKRMLEMAQKMMRMTDELVRDKN